MAELIGIKEDMKRMSKAIDENDTRSEIGVLKGQVQELQAEIRKTRTAESHTTRDEIGKNQGAVSKVKSKPKERSRGGHTDSDVEGIRKSQTSREKTQTVTETATESEWEETGGRRDRKRRAKRGTQKQANVIREQKTYSNIAGTTPPRQAGPGWKSPEQGEERYEAIVEVKNATETIQTIRKFKEPLGKQTSTIGSLKTLQPLKDGKLAIRFASRQQQDAVVSRVGQAGRAGDQD